MKNRTSLKHTLAILCVIALLFSVLPVSAFAMDLEAYYQQAIAEYQAQYEAALRQQIEQYEAAVQAYRESDGFDVEAVFEYLMSLEKPEEQKELFRSLNDRQRRMLVEFMLAKAEKGEFKEFYDPDFALKDEIAPELKAIEKERGITIYGPTEGEAMPEPAAEESAAKEASAEAPAESPALTEEEQFALDYAPYIEMYEKYGTAGNYSAISYDAFLRIQAMFSAPVAEEAAEENPVDESVDVEQPSDDEESAAAEPSPELVPQNAAEPVEELPEEPHELTEEEFLLTYYPDKVELYKEHRQFAQLNLDYETEQRIKAYVDEKYPLETVAEEPAAETPEAEVPATEAPTAEAPTTEAPAAENTVEEQPEQPETAETTEEDLVKEEPAEEESKEEDPAEEETPSDAFLPSDEYILPPEENPDPKEVTILSSLGDSISLGEPVILTGVLEDAEEFSDIIYIWEVDKGTGEYEAVADAENAASYSFPATIESLSWNWRLRVLYR